jgi:hypothetical protein
MGEIDIIEGVHDNEYNQVAWHTAPGCLLDRNEPFSGNISVCWFDPHLRPYLLIPA